MLVVEDHDDFRESLLDLLRLEGWTAVGARSADDAVTIARRQPIDIVLTDLILPGTDGLALERLLRSEAAFADIPFVFMSGYAPHRDAAGEERFLLKPFSVEQLRSVVRRAVERGE